MDEFDELLDDALTNETEGYTPKNTKLHTFIQDIDLDWDDDIEWDEE